jgi:formate dehydrogenase subunit gamma
MGTLEMGGAYRAMSSGYVDETWAKEHHLYGYNDIAAGKILTAPDAMGVATKDSLPILPSLR